jgi:hypothetical protein
MINSLSSLSQSQPVVPQQTQTQATPKPQSAPADTVQVSSAGKAALEEANETAAQTAQEASRGDVQAQRRMAIRGEENGTEQKSISALV